jgi:hypothetical protein
LPTVAVKQNALPEITSFKRITGLNLGGRNYRTLKNSQRLAEKDFMPLGAKAAIGRVALLACQFNLRFNNPTVWFLKRLGCGY